MKITVATPARRYEAELDESKGEAIFLQVVTSAAPRPPEPLRKGQERLAFVHQAKKVHPPRLRPAGQHHPARPW